MPYTIPRGFLSGPVLIIGDYIDTKDTMNGAQSLPDLQHVIWPNPVNGAGFGARYCSSAMLIFAARWYHSSMQPRDIEEAPELPTSYPHLLLHLHISRHHVH